MDTWIRIGFLQSVLEWLLFQTLFHLIYGVFFLFPRTNYYFYNVQIFSFSMIIFNLQRGNQSGLPGITSQLMMKSGPEPGF